MEPAAAAPTAPLPRIVVDALSARLGGGLSYLLHQLAAIERIAPDAELHVVAEPANASELRAALRARVTVVRAGPLRPLAEQVLLPLIGRRRGTSPPTVLYCPGNFAPLLPTLSPVVLTLQNPNYFGRGRHAPHNRSLDRRVRSRLARWSARRAAGVVVISNALLDELRTDEPEVAARAAMVTSGAPSWPAASTRPPSLPVEVDHFVLSLANDAPHKHLDRTIDAWVAAFGDREDREIPDLVVAGRCFDPERPRALRNRVPGALRARLHQIGGVTDRRQVRWLLEHAAVMVSSSTEEAHPLTPAEAGSLGCPLLLTDIPAHREVAGAHARFVPPGAVIDMADALRSLDGPVPRRPWTWPVTWNDNARGLLDVFTKVAR